MNPVLTLSGEPEPDVEKIVGDGLNAFNDAKVGYADRVPLHVIVRDAESGKIVGGISGKVSVLARGGNSAVSARRAECPSTWSPARA